MEHPIDALETLRSRFAPFVQLAHVCWGEWERQEAGGKADEYPPLRKDLARALIEFDIDIMRALKDVEEWCNRANQRGAA